MKQFIGWTQFLGKFVTRGESDFKLSGKWEVEGGDEKNWTLLRLFASVSPVVKKMERITYEHLSGKTPPPKDTFVPIVLKGMFFLFFFSSSFFFFLPPFCGSLACLTSDGNSVCVSPPKKASGQNCFSFRIIFKNSQTWLNKRVRVLSSTLRVWFTFLFIFVFLK